MSGMLKEQHSGQWGWELSEQGEENRGLGWEGASVGPTKGIG